MRAIGKRKAVGGMLPVDRTGKRPEPVSAADEALAQIALRIVDAALADAVQEALIEAYQLGVADGKRLQSNQMKGLQ